MLKGEENAERINRKASQFQTLTCLCHCKYGNRSCTRQGIWNQLTPPIDAIKAIFHGTYEFNLPDILVLGIVLGLFMMIYPAMANIRFEDLGKAARSPKQLLIVMFFNYAIAPFFHVTARQGISERNQNFLRHRKWRYQNESRNL